MTRNTLADLNDHLFAELERLGDEDLTGDNLASEISRAKSVASVASAIINNAGIQLQAYKLASEYQKPGSAPALPKMLADTVKDGNS